MQRTVKRSAQAARTFQRKNIIQEAASFPRKLAMTKLGTKNFPISEEMSSCLCLFHKKHNAMASVTYTIKINSRKNSISTDVTLSSSCKKKNTLP